MRPALKIALIYTLLGVAWILGSDTLLLALLGEESKVPDFQYFGTLKGIFYVLFTGALLYFLVRYYYQRLDAKVSELEELNRALEEQRKKLEASNGELEQFFFVASHDLQEPLRMVTGFLSKLEKESAEQLDKKSKSYIEYAVQGSKRMRQIILDLLEFSRAGKHDHSIADIHTSLLVDEIWKTLKSQREGREVVFSHEMMPVLKANQGRLTQVFRNLMENAIKYSDAQKITQIHLAAEPVGNGWKFSIKDNGIGIAPEYHQKIFDLFQRLHHKDEYPGTGLGLALVRKIIEQMGGKIWVESAEGEGSTFIFIIPQKQ